MRCLLLCCFVAAVVLAWLSVCCKVPLKPDVELPREIILDLGGGVLLELVRIDPGEFVMGSPVNEAERSRDEPQHPVEITEPFYLGKYEVTQEQYTRLTGKDNPSYFSPTGGGKELVVGLDTSRFPVEQVSWHDASAFCESLNGRYAAAVPSALRNAGYRFRLPTEAQWEYACRAGTTSPFHFGGEVNGTQANCDGAFPYGTNTPGRSLQRTCPVGSYEPNRWGLYDMHGNVWELCADWDCNGEYDSSERRDPVGPPFGKYRVLRGGGWKRDCTGSCRSAVRNGVGPGHKRNDLGFRVALVPPSNRRG
jgi:formylglycine-generating enzyme required for sulfatase activity